MIKNENYCNYGNSINGFSQKFARANQLPLIRFSVIQSANPAFPNANITTKTIRMGSSRGLKREDKKTISGSTWTNLFLLFQSIPSECNWLLGERLCLLEITVIDCRISGSKRTKYCSRLARMNRSPNTLFDVSKTNACGVAHWYLIQTS